MDNVTLWIEEGTRNFVAGTTTTQQVRAVVSAVGSMDERWVLRWYQRPAGSDAGWEWCRQEGTEASCRLRLRELGDDPNIETSGVDLYGWKPMETWSTWPEHAMELPGTGLSARPDGALVRLHP